MIAVPTLCLISTACRAAAPDDDQHAPPAERPGLRAEFAGRDGRVHLRVDPVLRFRWRDGRADPRPPAGPFTARWTGQLVVLSPGSYRLYVYAGGGAVRLTLAGRALLEGRCAEPRWLESSAAELDFGRHELAVEFHADGGPAEVGLYWSGPRFAVEPVPAGHLLQAPDRAVDDPFTTGRDLVRGLRCAACHDLPDARPLAAAPSLARLAGQIEPAWLLDWIGGPRPSAAAPAVGSEPPRDDTRAVGDSRASDEHTDLLDVKFRMPGLGMSREDARHVAAWLLANSTAPETPVAPPAAPPGDAADSAGDEDAASGEKLFHTLGCLACHRLDGAGSHGLYGGGDLSRVGGKRPAAFFDRWLADPAATNPAHRMPIMPLSADERRQLAAYLATRVDRSAGAVSVDDAREPAGDAERGRQLVAAHRCAACHDVPSQAIREAAPAAPAKLSRLGPDSDWQRGCLGEPNVEIRRPGYRLRPSQRAAVQHYVAEMATADARDAQAPADATDRPFDGRRLLVERNCLACHARGLGEGLRPHAAAAVAGHPEWAPWLPAMTPPALSGVGDKLHEAALAQAIAAEQPGLRPWLQVRMPRYRWSPQESRAVVEHFLDSDRIPDRPPTERAAPRADDAALDRAGPRLVTSDGFGCASCHQIGRAVPKQDNLAARGTDLSLVGARIRPSWFERWVRNPARIIPRMEMPAIEVPVRGVLDDRLDDQLAAVWRVLNRPGFTPPAGGAVRVVRTRNLPAAREPAAVLCDVFHVDRQVFIRPMVIALANRHTVLVDLEEGRLAGWWVGDAARERTEDKSWLWESAGTHVLPTAEGPSDWTLLRGGVTTEPRAVGQCRAALDSWEHVAGGVRLSYRLAFPATGRDDRETTLRVAETFTALLGAESDYGFRRHVELTGLSADDAMLWRPAPAVQPTVDSTGRQASLGGPTGGVSLRLNLPLNGRFSSEAGAGVTLQAGTAGAAAVAVVDYVSTLRSDRHPQPAAAPLGTAATRFDVVPGFEAVRLPLPATEMPTALVWRKDGTLLFSSLKGQVFLVRDSDGDGLADQLQAFSDDLAAPYGLHAGDDWVDVLNKNGLLRLWDRDGDDRAERTEIVAAGWGQTDDYHDWAVGLTPAGDGGYFLALPCYQDQRTTAGGHLRGGVVRLAPRVATADDPRRFTVSQVCTGLRFPMGLARNRAGALFATDNQGNYNPFNELNHVRPGAHFGFFNKQQAQSPSLPPRTDPAVDLPHPWTRSVNGICFLETPAAVREQLGRDLFGPYEGHLVGCEYDTRRLVRISLQPVGETFQGAVYPLSVEPAEGAPTFEGPVACGIAPNGDVYVGNLRDSGWGGGQNTGSIVRLRFGPALPAGIAEVRAHRRGFTVDFTAPVDAGRAANPDNYALVSYRRRPTPEYGGPDIDRRTDRIQSVQLLGDRRQAQLIVDQLRPGFLYELRVKNLAGQRETFHPAEAYYTLRTVPD